MQSEFKKCRMCEKVYYCSKECQARDWPSHKAVCAQKVQHPCFSDRSRDCLEPSGAPLQQIFSSVQQHLQEFVQVESAEPGQIDSSKLQDPLPSASEKRLCGLCGSAKPGSGAGACPCGTVWYCSSGCQQSHWQEHKRSCSARAKKKDKKVK
mmetsp:Transcript_26423/g.61636  ORF Transcript_26423/g.61636 Transcript_26423/m.61636 type:complete len:152 (+) Transcript_26423:531-986(+)